MDAYCVVGTPKGAARRLGRQVRTVTMQLARARERMGGRPAVLCALDWCDWRRAEAAKVMQAQP
jgi:hypothetical protein